LRRGPRYGNAENQNSKREKTFLNTIVCGRDIY
jgi:hypothetical protein